MFYMKNILYYLVMFLKKNILLCQESKLIKSFVNPFVDIASTFFDSSFNSFSISTCFVLFELIVLLKLKSLLAKSVWFKISNITFTW